LAGPHAGNAGSEPVKEWFNWNHRSGFDLGLAVDQRASQPRGELSSIAAIGGQ
jgi:hypothetical protein